MANCQIVLLKEMALTLGNQMTDIRKAARKARLTLTKDDQYLNNLKNLVIMKILVKNVSNMVSWDKYILWRIALLSLLPQYPRPQKRVKPTEE